MKSRSWLAAFLCLFLVGALAAACDSDAGKDDGQGGKQGTQKVTLPAHGYDEGKDEPDKTRVHVDNSASTISVEVRTPRTQWERKLAVDLNGRRTVLTRGAPDPQGRCAPQVDQSDTSLITKLSFPRTCVENDGRVTAKVTVDGEKPVKAVDRETKAPNVLMVMVDDMRTDELQYMPNVQKYIADQGVTFTNGFASLPLCCPARASVFTGQYPHNHGVWSQKPPWGFSAMKDEETFPVWISRAGYRNAFIGKYLNRFGRDPEPDKTKGNSLQYVPPGWENFHASVDGLPKGKGGVHQYFNTTLQDNGKGFISNKGKYQSVAFTEFEQELLGKEKGQKDPFFHYVSFSAPHAGGPHEDDDPEDLKTPSRPDRVKGIFDDVITEAPGANWEDPDLSDKPKSMRSKPLSDEMKKQALESTRQRAESLYMVDKGVGEMIRTLEKNGQLDNTMVVFTSDNGYFLGEQGMPQGKILPYEPSLRVPVLMRGPGIPQGELRSDPFLSVDFAPTFADMADAKITGEVDGVSMLDVARLGDTSADDKWSRVVPTETLPLKSVIKKLKREQPIGLKTEKTLRGTVTGLRTHQYLYTERLREPSDRGKDIDVELYDVLKDPDQVDNLAVDPENKALLARLHKVLAKARTCAAETCQEPLPEDLR